MSIMIEAVYEQGTLRLAQPLPLAEHQKVRVTVHTEASPLSEAYGIIGWNGDAQTLRRIAEDPAFGILEAP